LRLIKALATCLFSILYQIYLFFFNWDNSHTIKNNFKGFFSFTAHTRGCDTKKLFFFSNRWRKTKDNRCDDVKKKSKFFERNCLRCDWSDRRRRTDWRARDRSVYRTCVYVCVWAAPPLPPPLNTEQLSFLSFFVTSTGSDVFRSQKIIGKCELVSLIFPKFFFSLLQYFPVDWIIKMAKITKHTQTSLQQQQL
jgi:hypothetical protein